MSGSDVSRHEAKKGSDKRGVRGAGTLETAGDDQGTINTLQDLDGWHQNVTGCKRVVPSPVDLLFLTRFGAANQSSGRSRA